MRLDSVAYWAPGGMWSFTVVGLPVASYMRKTRASASSAFLMAVRMTLGFSTEAKLGGGQRAGVGEGLLGAGR
jgi:hypothetical protein